MATIGRPPSCLCGACAKCRRRVYMRDWYRRQTPEKRAAIVASRDPEAVRAAERRRVGTARRRSSSLAASLIAKEREPHKTRARQAVANAVRDGLLTKGTCHDCGSAVVDGHHYLGYEPEHWLHVQWLCRAHHRALHERLAAQSLPF